MEYNNIRFEFKGFDPDYKIKSLIISTAENIQMLAPSDATLRMTIRKGKRAVRASCRIASLAGIFVAQTVDRCPVQAVQQLEKKLTNQLDQWKKRRFSPFYFMRNTYEVIVLLAALIAIFGQWNYHF